MLVFKDKSIYEKAKPGTTMDMKIILPFLGGKTLDLEVALTLG